MSTMTKILLLIIVGIACLIVGLKIRQSVKTHTQQSTHLSDLETKDIFEKDLHSL